MLNKFEDSQIDPNKNNVAGNLIRHSKATYSSYKEINLSDKPNQAFKAEKQVVPDLSMEGIEYAREQAEVFFDSLNPEEEDLFFVSSNEARAVETASIYHDIAKERKFNIVKPENSRSKISDELTNGDVRIIQSLSLNIKNVLIPNLLNPESARRQINMEALTVEERETYGKVKEMIDQDNKGSFPANFLAYGDLVKKYYPEFETAEDMYNHHFKNLIRLVKFSKEKVSESKNNNNDGEQGKRLRILAFSHENQLLIALNLYFNEHGIDNCEVLNFECLDDDNIKLGFRGKEAVI